MVSYVVDGREGLGFPSRDLRRCGVGSESYSMEGDAGGRRDFLGRVTDGGSDRTCQYKPTGREVTDHCL